MIKIPWKSSPLDRCGTGVVTSDLLEWLTFARNLLELLTLSAVLGG
jgi:hypothetical protein